MQIIEEMPDVLVINKPSGLISHRDGRTIEPSVAEWLGTTYPALRAIGESWRSPQGEHVAVCGLVHRLDRTTSGVMLVAKTQGMYAALKQALKERRVEKEYVAFVHGHLADEGHIAAEIVRSKEISRRWFARPCDEGNIRAAITDWRAIKRFEKGGEYAYVQLQPKTGRTHQLRVHLTSIGHPLVGDTRYGGEAALGFDRPALHASIITCEIEGKRRTFSAPLPDDFVRALSLVGTN